MDSNSQTEEPDQDITKEKTFVWAKLGGNEMNFGPVFRQFLGHPFWPAQVVDPSGTGLSCKKGQVVVKFFGTNDYASVKVCGESLKKYDDFKDQKPRKKRNKNFLKAVKQIERAMRGEPVESETEEKASPAPQRKRKSEVVKTEVAKKGRPEVKSPARSRTQSPRVSSRASPASSSKSTDNDELAIGPVNGTKKDTNSSSLEKVINQVPPSEDRIGFIGCGIMGTPMALNLKKTGHNVSVYNRTLSKTQVLRDAGITVYETLRQVIENCDIVFGKEFYIRSSFHLVLIR